MTMWLDIAVALLGLALVTRLTIIATCALLDAARRIRAPDPSTPPDDPSTWPLLSVIVPMYNEREVIDDTLRAILASDYPSFECIVVDDGSTDGCGERVRAMVTSDGLIQLLDQKVNGGKPAALNAGIHAARGQLICTVDADTRLAPDTLTRIAAGLSSPQTSAVACNVKVGNANRWLTRWQSIEYVTALNLDRRAQHTWNTITTVPGAASGWKRAALLSCGGFSNDTMTEDADLSITMLRDGHTIRFLHRAVAYTHAPTDLGALFRQRRRWLFGNLQCAWKHRGGLLGRSTMTLRLLGLPNFWFAHFFALVLV